MTPHSLLSETVPSQSVLSSPDPPLVGAPAPSYSDWPGVVEERPAGSDEPCQTEEGVDVAEDLSKGFVCRCQLLCVRPCFGCCRNVRVSFNVALLPTASAACTCFMSFLSLPISFND